LRPHTQPPVNEIFRERWLDDLRRDVETALRSLEPSIPVLYDVIEPPQSSSTDEGTWQGSWAELLRIADSALDVASTRASGIPVSQDLLASGRKQLAGLREHVPGGLELQLYSQLPVGPMSPARNVRTRASATRPQLPRDLDFARLGHFICNSPEVRRASSGGGSSSSGSSAHGEPLPSRSLPAVLRALLQRLASAESPLGRRRGVLFSIACFDVLGVHSRPEALPELLGDPSTAELTLGILAVLACEAVGRTYVSANLHCVGKMAQLLKEQPLDSALHTQALAAMQRLSLRRATQDCIIELGLVEWVVGVLGWQGEAIHGAPSEFSLEFGSALLLNLALRTAGKRRCAAIDTLTVALNLAEHWNPQIRTHINGTLYCLLSLRSFRTHAQDAGLEGILQGMHARARRGGDDIYARQVEYLLQQLNPEDDASEAEAGAESGEDDEDDDENFLEEEELAGLLLGDRCGHAAEETLRDFLATPPVAEAQSRAFRDFLSQQ